MSSPTVTLFVDTNGFLHLRDLKDLPWHVLFPKAARIDIMIASCVIEELDDFKTGNNGRKRDRARLALKLIEDASKADDLSLILRLDPIEIRIVIASGPPVDWSQMPKLDPAKPDDQLVAEAVACGNGAAVFSHDSGPRIRARIANIEALEPPDDWFLPAEKTDDQRKVSQLERDLERALSTVPRIIVAVDSMKQETGCVDLYVPILPQIEQHVVEYLANAYFAEHPSLRLSAASRDVFGIAAIRMSDSYSEHDVSNYHSKYAKFRENVRSYFANLHKIVARTAYAAPIKYIVKNDSGVAARGLRIDAQLSGEAFLLADAEDARLGSLIPPSPPERPKTVRDRLTSQIGDFSNFNSINKPRDPTKFFWFERPEHGAIRSALQCEDYRATRVWEDEIWIWVQDQLPFWGNISLHISATNLPTPVNIEAKISMSKRSTDWSDEKVLESLPEALRDLFAKIR
jgi:hypothetical protein